MRSGQVVRAFLYESRIGRACVQQCEVGRLANSSANKKDRDMKAAMLVVLAVCVQGAVTAQEAAKQAKFEVASLRRESEEATPGHGSTGVGFVEITSQRASYRSISLRSLLMKAYGVQRFQISGPGWIDSDRYDVVATIPEGTPVEDVPVMLQNLLIERFQMKLRRVPKSYEGYVLSVGKGGPKLTPAAHREVGAPTASLSMGEHPEEHMYGMTMAALANVLSIRFAGPVVDSTQLDGKFDISMPFSLDGPEEQTNTITGLRDLGLTLTPGKVQLEAIVVDEAKETPGEN